MAYLGSYGRRPEIYGLRIALGICSTGSVRHGRVPIEYVYELGAGWSRTRGTINWKSQRRSYPGRKCEPIRLKIQDSSTTRPASKAKSVEGFGRRLPTRSTTVRKR